MDCFEILPSWEQFKAVTGRSKPLYPKASDLKPKKAMDNADVNQDTEDLVAVMASRLRDLEMQVCIQIQSSAIWYLVRSFMVHCWG